MLVSPKFRQLLLICVVLTFFTSISLAYSGGAGTAESPYKIWNPSDLIQLSNSPADYDKYFVMMTNISLSGRTFTQAVIAGSREFQGNFNGNGHKISNLTINSTSGNPVGLFGDVGANAVISNLGVTKVIITSTRNYVGGFCGSNKGTINKCMVTGKISGYDTVGGFCGMNEGIITNCYSTGSVTGDRYVGGFCGLYDQGVECCYTASVVTAATEARGGFSCYGASYSSRSFWDIAVSGLEVDYSTDGYAGMETSEMQGKSLYTKSGWDFSDTDGDAADWKMVPGYYPVLAWETPVLMSVPDMTGQAQSHAVQTLAGLGLAVMVRTGFDSQYPAGQVCAQSTVGKSRQSSTVILYISSGVQKYSGGSGIIAAPYQIANKDDLIDLGANTDDYEKSFILTSDIDMADAGTFDRAVIAGDTNPTTSSFDGMAFRGRFNGCGHKISDLKISGQSYIGLFGYMEGYALVKNLGLTDIAVSGSGNNVGGICGYENANTGVEISRCYVTGSVSGDSAVGGLVGCADEVRFEACYNNANIIGNVGVGGIYGSGDDYIGGYGLGNGIVRSYNSGAISGSDYIGGLCGRSNGYISSSYSAGGVTGISTVGGLCGLAGYIIHNSFWDKQASGITVGVGSGSGLQSSIIGLDTVDMQKQATFTASGWDFTTDDGDGADWQMKAGCYPYLDWQVVDGDVAGSNAVDMADLEYLAANWLTEVIVTDLDGNGQVDMPDFAKLAANWLR